jgi:putative transposase
MTKEQKAVAAVNAFNTGEAVRSIVTRFKCSKSWLYKWVARYKANPAGSWYLEESRRPKTLRLSGSAQEEQAVIAARLSLEAKPYSQRGAISIQYELKTQQQQVVPVWKINKILKKANLITKEPKDKKRINEYPFIGTVTDQMDFVGPRYVKNDGRYYSLNIIDTTTHFVHINPLRSRETQNVLQSVVRFWQKRGMPDFMQMDNELSFRGSNRHPHSFSKLIRLALSLNITVVFIPIKEPWRNGMIEKFNDSFNRRFIKGKTYDNFLHLQACAKEFEDFHNQFHRYNTHKNKTPNEQIPLEFDRDRLPFDFVIPEENMPLKQGKIILVRFIRSNLLLDVFGEKFLLPHHLEYSYVVALIDVENQLLIVLRDNQVQWQIFYKIE